VAGREGIWSERLVDGGVRSSGEHRLCAKGARLVGNHQGRARSERRHRLERGGSILLPCAGG
jgi:hypothetical protein